MVDANQNGFATLKEVDSLINDRGVRLCTAHLHAQCSCSVLQRLIDASDILRDISDIIEGRTDEDTQGEPTGDETDHERLEHEDL